MSTGLPDGIDLQVYLNTRQSRLIDLQSMHIFTVIILLYFYNFQSIFGHFLDFQSYILIINLTNCLIKKYKRCDENIFYLFWSHYLKKKNNTWKNIFPIFIVVNLHLFFLYECQYTFEIHKYKYIIINISIHTAYIFNAYYVQCISFYSDTFHLIHSFSQQT